MFPYAITLGNTFVLKPSERVANTTMYLAKLVQEIGVPKGVLNIVHGGFDTVRMITEHEKIRAVSFVGGNQAGDYIYSNGAKTHKRMQINMGAKNHCVVLPDADREDTINALVSASFGATGQRCMALTTAVMVGESQNWLDDIVTKAKKLKLGSGFDQGVDIAPLCYPEVIKLTIYLHYYYKK